MLRILLLIIVIPTGWNLVWAQSELPVDPALCILPEDAIALDKGFGRQQEDFLWPGNIVPYEIQTAGFPPSELAEIDASIPYFNAVTNICLVPRTSEEDYVYIARSGGSSFASSIGFTGGMHVIGLGLNVRRRTHIHEFGHIVGLFHEHQRPDRDEYITVFSGNVISEYLHNFNPYPEDTDQFYWSEKYDFNSVMHYHPWAFSQDGSRTIKPNDPEVVIPYNNFFSPSDLATLAKLYPRPVDCDSVYRANLLDGAIEFVEQVDEVCRYSTIEAHFVSTQGDPADWEYTWEVSGGEVISTEGPRAVLRLTESRRQEVTVSIQKGAYSRTYEKSIVVSDPEPMLEILGNPVTAGRINYRFTAVNENVAVWLTDAGGRRLHSETTRITDCVTQRSIDCSGYSAGIYTLTIFDGQQRRSRKVQLP